MRVGTRFRTWVTPVIDRIVYASSAYVDLKATLVSMSADLVRLTEPAGGPAGERLLAAVRMIRPVRVPGMGLVRVGGSGDGGYVMSDQLRCAGALSLGVGPDVSWDIDVARRGVPVAMFDPTVRRTPQPVPGGRFHRIGVAASPVDPPEYRPLKELITLAGFDACDDLLLKIDVEGAEWGALSAAGGDLLRPFRQIAIEMHDLARLRDEQAAVDVLAALEALGANHVPIHVHGNNYSRLVRFDRLWFPDAIEVTYVRRDLATGAVPAEAIASPLDAPSDPRVPDLDLEGLLAVSPVMGPT